MYEQRTLEERLNMYTGISESFIRILYSMASHLLFWDSKAALGLVSSTSRDKLQHLVKHVSKVHACTWMSAGQPTFMYTSWYFPSLILVFPLNPATIHSDINNKFSSSKASNFKVETTKCSFITLNVGEIITENALRQVCRHFSYYWYHIALYICRLRRNYWKKTLLSP